MPEANYHYPGMDEPGDPGANMLNDLGAVVRVDRARVGGFRYLVCETLHLDSLHIAEAEQDGGVWLTEDTEHGLCERLYRVALFARLRAQVECGAMTFALSPQEIPRFRSFLADVLFAEAECEASADEYGEVLTVVASRERVELVESLVEQIGGLL